MIILSWKWGKQIRKIMAYGIPVPVVRSENTFGISLPLKLCCMSQTVSTVVLYVTNIFHKLCCMSQTVSTDCALCQTVSTNCAICHSIHKLCCMSQFLQIVLYATSSFQKLCCMSQTVFTNCAVCHKQFPQIGLYVTNSFHTYSPGLCEALWIFTLQENLSSSLSQKYLSEHESASLLL